MASPGVGSLSQQIMPLCSSNRARAPLSDGSADGKKQISSSRHLAAAVTIESESKYVAPDCMRGRRAPRLSSGQVRTVPSNVTSQAEKKFLLLLRMARVPNCFLKTLLRACLWLLVCLIKLHLKSWSASSKVAGQLINGDSHLVSNVTSKAACDRCWINQTIAKFAEKDQSDVQFICKGTKTLPIKQRKRIRTHCHRQGR